MVQQNYSLEWTDEDLERLREDCPPNYIVNLVQSKNGLQPAYGNITTKKAR